MIVSLDEVKNWLDIDGTAEDMKLNFLIEGVEKFVENYTNKFFSLQEIEELISLKVPSNEIVLKKVPVKEILEIKVNVGSMKNPVWEDYQGDWTLTEYGSIVFDRYFIGENILKVKYVAGYDVVPSDIKLATLQLIEYWYKKGGMVDREWVSGAGISYKELKDVYRILDLYKY